MILIIAGHLQIHLQIQTGCFYLFTLLLATGLKIKENNNNTERKELNCKTSFVP